MKKALKRFAALLLSVTMLATGINFTTFANTTTDLRPPVIEELAPAEKAAPKEELDLFRDDFSVGGAATQNLGVVSGNAKIKHLPYEPVSYELAGKATKATRSTTAAVTHSYKAGDTKLFRLDMATGYKTVKYIKAKVLKVGKNTNLWVLDDKDYHTKLGTKHDAGCTLNSVTATMQSNAVAKFDAIYSRMTNSSTGFSKHSGYLVETGYSNVPAIGDLGKDGKVNVLLYDIQNDGSDTSSNGYIAGFFSNGDMFDSIQQNSYSKAEIGNAIDLFHMDIGKTQGLTSFSSTSEAVSADFYSTFAHEFQHMLFEINFSIFARTISPSKLVWITEALSAAAEMYYTIPGKQFMGFGRTIYAATNDYDNGYNGYGDFFNFNNSGKSYGIANAHASMMYQRTKGSYARNFYSYITSGKLSNSSWKIKSSYISSAGLEDIFGGGFKKALGSSFSKYTNQQTFDNLYYIFMENLAADGGTISNYYTSGSSKGYKMSTTNSITDNLWSIRPALGGNLGGLDISALGKIPTIKHGSTITLKGTNSNYTGVGASQEMMYKIGSNITSPYLSINIPATSGMKYYIALPNSSTSLGANLYKMNSGVTNRINTGGKTAYLYVVTLKKNISTKVSMSWSKSVSYKLTVLSATGGSARANTTTFTPGKKITMIASPSVGYRLKGYSISGATISGSSFTMPKSDVRIKPIFEKLPYALSYIKVTTKPKKLTYTAGEKFSKTGMVVTAKFSNGKTSNVTSSAIISPSTALKTSNTYARVSYTYGGVTKTTTVAIKVHAKPAVLTAKIPSKSADAIRVSWNQMAGASGYEVYRARGSSSGSYTRVYTATKGTTLTYVNRGLSTGTAYYYKVRSYKVASGKKVYSAFSKAVGARPTLSTPTLKITALKESAKIEWSKVSGATGYVIERRSPGSSKYIAIKTMNASTSSYTQLVMLSGKTYYYRIRAYKLMGINPRQYSAYSAVKAVTPK